MKLLPIILVLLFFTACNIKSIEDNKPSSDNAELIKMAKEDQADRMKDSDEPLEPKDEVRRKRVMELLADNRIITNRDKFNAALILQHTGLMFCNNELKSMSVENYYLAYLLAKSAFENGYKDAAGMTAATYDRYSWLAYGYQKYGTQGTYENDKEVWVKFDSTTTDSERAIYGIEPLQKLLSQKPVQK